MPCCWTRFKDLLLQNGEKRCKARESLKQKIGSTKNTINAVDVDQNDNSLIRHEDDGIF